MNVAAILELLKASGLGDILTDMKDAKVQKMKANLRLITIIVDNMDDKGKCDAKELIKSLVKTNTEVFTDEPDF